MSFAEWRKRRAAREAMRSGDPWVCPYCRALHPAFDVGGTKFAFGYPSVKFGCCGKVAFMLKDAKTGDLLRFTRIGDGVTEWLPKEAYFAWVAQQSTPRGHRDGTPHAEVVAKGIVQDVASLRPKPRAAVVDEAPTQPAPAPLPAAGPVVFVAVAKLDEVPAGTAKVLDVNGKRIALFNVAGSFHAMDDTCAHAKTSLGASPVEDGIVTCNGHGWRYDVRSGQCENRPDVRLRSYPVKVEDGKLLVGA